MQALKIASVLEMELFCWGGPVVVSEQPGTGISVGLEKAEGGEEGEEGEEGEGGILDAVCCRCLEKGRAFLGSGIKIPAAALR